MHFRLAMTALLACSSVWAAPPPDAPVEAAREVAVWVPVQLTFVYRHLTTTYSCSGLQLRMKSLLLKLGARPDLDVRSYGCTELTGPDPFAGVKIRMSVLEPRGAQSWVEAHWKRVDLLEDRNLLDAAGDCELIEQVEQQILPLFAARNVDYNATCQARALVPGATRLRADVLVANPRPPSAAR